MAFKLLDAATATGVSESIDFRSRKPINHTVQLDYTGSPTVVEIDLEGSLDGDNWISMASHTAGGTPDMFHVTDKMVRHLRVNLTTLTGGTSPTVTVRYEAS